MYEWRDELQKLNEKYFPGGPQEGASISGVDAYNMLIETQRITRRGIYADAQEQTPFKTVDDAENAAFMYGHEYRAIWLQANTEAGNLDDPYIKYYATLFVYSTAPYNSLKKKNITGLLTIRPDDYLKELDPDTADPLTVYRGGGELTEREANNALSWTTDLNTAVFFYNRRLDGGQLWQAKIYKKDVIAYYNGRSESEILQYRKVKHIEPMELTDDEIAAALDERAKQ